MRYSILLLLVCLFGVSAPAANWVLAVNEKATSTVYGVTNAVNWKSGGQFGEAGAPLNPADSYSIGDAKALYTLRDNLVDTVFLGRSLTLTGNPGRYARIVHVASGTARTSWDDWGSNAGITLNNYSQYQAANARGTVGLVYGQFTIGDSDKCPPMIYMANGGTTLDFRGSFAADAEDTLIVAYSNADATVVFSGDLSSFGGKLLAQTGFRQEDGTWVGCRSNAKLELGTTELPGFLGVDSPGITLTTVDSDDVFDVGRLRLGDGVVLAPKIDGTTFECGRIRVTGALEMLGVVKLTFPEELTADALSGHSFGILTVPVSAGLDRGRFLVKGGDASLCSYGLTVEPDAGGATKTLYVTFLPTVRQTQADPTKTDADPALGSAFTNAACWSDGKVPHEGSHYLSMRGGLRTELAEHYEFAGESLTIDDGSTLYLGVSELEIADLRFRGNGAMHSVKGVYPRICGGTITVEPVSGTRVEFRVWGGRIMTIDSVLRGYGDLRFGNISGSSSVSGTTYLNRENPDFQGRLAVTGRSGYSTMNVFQTLCISNALCLGGPLPALEPRALALDLFARLESCASEVVIPASCNRGFYIGDVGRILVGGIAGTDERRLTLGTCLTVDGKLIKEGAGTLALDCPVRFGPDSSENPEPGKNLLTISEGRLSVSDADALDGLAVDFAEGASLSLEPDFADARLMRYGIRVVKSGPDPFVLAPGATKLPLSFGSFDSAAIPRGDFTIALLTVSSDAADAVRGMLPDLGRRPLGRGLALEPTELTDAETGDVTFAYNVTHCGFVLLFR